MSKLTSIRPEKLIKLCEKFGWQRREARGSHQPLVKEGEARPIVILLAQPNAPYIQNQIMKRLGLQREEYLKIIRDI